MTQLGIRSESVGAGDQSWLGSRHGTETPKSATLDPTAWTAKTTNGTIKSGEPFGILSATGLAVPYNSGGSGGAEKVAGFILTDQSVIAGAGNITFPGIEGEALIIALDLKGLACSTGAACSSGAVEPSHVLTAISLPPEEARASIRFSLGRHSTEADIAFALEVVPAAVAQLRELSPAYQK